MFEATFCSDRWIAPDPRPTAIWSRRGWSTLSAADVRQILDRAIATANQTRAIIRLPIGSRARMVIAVADLDGTVLGLYRMPDATFFSIDVAVAKSRNMVYFSGPGGGDLPGVPDRTAVTNRTIGFGAQPFFPPGIDGSDPGHSSISTSRHYNPCTQGSHRNPNQNGIVFFPGHCRSIGTVCWWAALVSAATAWSRTIT